MAKLVRIDRNGTKYYEDYCCPACGGTGYIDAFAYNEGGRCFTCGGSGYYFSKWKEYTPEYREILNQRRLDRAKAKAPQHNAELFKKMGLSEDGSAYVVLGDTYSIKEDLKEQGATFSRIIGWHFSEEHENTVKLEISDFAEENIVGEWIFNEEKAMDAINSKVRTVVSSTSESEYVGSVGDKITANVTVERIGSYIANVTYDGILTYVITFKDEDGNVFVWRTATYVEFEQGDKLTIKGTVKEHSLYRNVKQTRLVRVKVI